MRGYPLHSWIFSTIRIANKKRVASQASNAFVKSEKLLPYSSSLSERPT